MKKSTLLLSLLFALAVAACDQQTEGKPDAEADQSAPQEQKEQKEQPMTSQEPAPRPEELIWVFQARGDRQCEGGGISLDQSGAKLTDSGVQVHESRCGTRTDKMYPSVCGGATGNILLHLISGDALDAALQLGFDPADKIHYQQRGSCPADDPRTPSVS